MCKIIWTHGIVSLKDFWDNRGSLLPIEFEELPFVPKRMFFVNGVPSGTIRGQHAHKICKQLFICLSGIIVLHINDKKSSSYYSMQSYDGIYIPEKVWSSQKFYENASALVLASEKHNEYDYIRSFGEFISE